MRAIKTILHITATAAIAVCIFSYGSPYCGFVMHDIDGDGTEEFLLGDQFENGDYVEQGRGYLCGGYTEQREPAEEDMNIFRKVMDESLFTPLSVSTQVVAGLNYRFRCRYDDGTGSSPIQC